MFQKKNLKIVLKTNPLENVTLSKERGETICQRTEEDADAVSVLETTAYG